MLDDEPEWHLVKTSRDSSDSREQQWVDLRRSAYLNRERRFLLQLMTVMHIVADQPARGPELVSIKVVNSVYSARNIYVINGRVVFLTTYDKALQRRNKGEFVLRCLPDAVSQLVAKYIIYIRPFSQVVGQRQWDFMFTD